MKRTNTKENIMKDFLITTPQARERRQKVRAIAFLLQKLHPAIRELSKDLMIEIVDDTIAFERYWRKTLQNYPELRGSDYNTKKEVVQKKMLEMGVAEIGFNQKIV